MKDYEAIIACVVGCVAIVLIVTGCQLPINIARIALIASILIMVRYVKNKFGEK